MLLIYQVSSFFCSGQCPNHYSPKVLYILVVWQIWRIFWRFSLKHILELLVINMQQPCSSLDLPLGCWSPQYLIVCLLTSNSYVYFYDIQNSSIISTKVSPKCCFKNHIYSDTESLHINQPFAFRVFFFFFHFCVFVFVILRLCITYLDATRNLIQLIGDSTFNVSG